MSARGFVLAAAALLAGLLALTLASAAGAVAPSHTQGISSDAPVALANADADADADAATTLTLSTADFCRRDGDAVPGPDCAWAPVPLAKLWQGDRQHPTSDGWFRLHLALPAVPARGLALYIVAFNRSGRLFVNGQYAHEFGPMTQPLPLNWNHAQYATIPPALLHAGDNTLEIQQRIYWWENGWLAPVRVGSEEVLRPIYERRHFWQNDLVRILGATTAAIGVFMLGVWLGRRSHAMYFWFGCVCLLWTAISLDYFALVAPLPALAWEDFVESAQVLRALLMFMFALRYSGRRRPVLETLMWLYFALGSAALFGHLVTGRAVDAWYFVTLLVSPYFFWLLVREGLRNGLAEGVMLGLAAIAQIGLSAYDLWVFSAHSWTDRVYLAHFSAPLTLLVVGWILVQRFAHSLNAYERLASVLEQRVGEKAAELERNYEQLLEARRNEALALERTRIMSEMHDGIGSQLTLALSLVRGMDREQHEARVAAGRVGAKGEEGVAGQVADGSGPLEDGRVATVLRESIEDLQLIIDSLEPVENDLLTVLGTLRYRLQDRLSKSGIELQWHVVDLPPLPSLTPHSVLSVLRIVQEAFANCLKHSRAGRIVVSTALAGTRGVDETACISIVDDGRGIDGSRVGRGLENMRRRAEALGGRLRITSRPGNTEVMLEIPTLRVG